MQQTATVDQIPKGILVAAFILVCTVIAVVAGARLAGYRPDNGLGQATSVESRMLRFADMPNGGVSVTDAVTGQTVSIADPGTNGFLRGSLRGLMRARKREGVDFSEPFRLERWSNGDLTLLDPKIGTLIDLNAFGHTNTAVYSAFLKQGGTVSQ